MSALKQLLQDKTIKYVDLRFTDIIGTEHHITVAADLIDDNFIQEGKCFDGSSIAGWCPINQSDMLLKLQPDTAVLDPFMLIPTVIARCDVFNPHANQPYDRCPRVIAQRAEQYLKATGIADTVFFGPEPEFFVFDDVRFSSTTNQSFYQIDSSEGCWNSKTSYEQGNMAHRPGLKGGYFPLPPIDSLQDLRAEMCKHLEAMGLEIEAHHHEVATGGQCEICFKFASLLDKADQMQVFKYVVRNTAQAFGKTATFMPKPLMGDNGSGMHCHQSLAKDGVNLFSGDQYAGLSQLALYYIGGIIKHAPALNAFTNPGTNSYRRLVPGFEAPVMLAYSACNRSAAIRIPQSSSLGRRIEVRFPDPTANPYLAFSAMLLAGLDGIQNKIDPGVARDDDLYELSADQEKIIPKVCNSLDQALAALQNDHQFLLKGGVFSEDFITNYISMKEKEVSRIRAQTNPVEFEMYYSA
jgi:glutamine synthetase